MGAVGSALGSGVAVGEDVGEALPDGVGVPDAPGVGSPPWFNSTTRTMIDATSAAITTPVIVQTFQARFGFGSIGAQRSSGCVSSLTGHASRGAMGCQDLSRPSRPPSRRPRNRLLVPRTVRSTKNNRMISFAKVIDVPRPNSTGL